MVDGILFDKLAKIAESLKKNPRSKTASSKPFGGIQVRPFPPSISRPSLSLALPLTLARDRSSS